MTRLEVFQDAGRAEVLLDGKTVRCRAVDVSYRMERLPEAVIEPVIVAAATIAEPARVLIPDSTRDLLVALGWTPPGETEKRNGQGEVRRGAPAHIRDGADQ